MTVASVAWSHGTFRARARVYLPQPQPQPRLCLAAAELFKPICRTPGGQDAAALISREGEEIWNHTLYCLCPPVLCRTTAQN